jgi:Acyl-CoA hydrolase
LSEQWLLGWGHRSVEVFVKVLGEHLMTGERFVGFTCFLTYVVPGAESGLAYDELIADNDETKYLLAGYQDRRAQRATVRQQERDLLAHLSCE